MLFDRANSQLQNIILQHGHHHPLCIFESNEQEPVCCACTGMHQWGNPLSPSSLLKCSTNCAHCAHIHHSISINTQQMLVNVNGCHFFCMEDLIPPLCFIHASMTDTILPRCPSAVVCHTATKHNGILVGRFSLYCHQINICFWSYSRRQYFQSSPCIMALFRWHFLLGNGYKKRKRESKPIEKS